MTLLSQFPAIADALLLRDLAVDTKETLFGKANILRADKDRMILRQGRPADAVYVIVEGSVEIMYASPEGHRTIIGHGGPGQALGAIEVVADRLCVANCTLHAGTTAIAWTPEVFRATLDDRAVVRNIAHIAYKALEHDNAAKVIDQFYTAEQRICSYLGKLAVGGVTFRQSQSYLANAVGCTRQTVNKELSHLKQKGVIEISKGKVLILDQEGLSQRISELDEKRASNR